jgi:hypothetical protein
MNVHSLPAPLRAACASSRSSQAWLRLPFDAVRSQHARWVQAGLLKRSLLASGNFETTLGAAERLMLGPFARRR